MQISKNRCREETIIYYNKKWKLLKEILSNLNLTMTSDINKNSYNQVINVLKLKSYKNITINKYMDLLKSIMKVNYELELIPNNPIANIKKLPETIPNIEIISKDNILKIIDYIEKLKPNFLNIRNKLIIYLLNDTGARINEIVNIESKNVKIDSKAIYLSFTKTKEPR